MITKEILNRRAVREYKADDVPEELIMEIIKAGQFAPTAKGSMGIEYIVIKEQKTKDDIFKIVGQQFIKQAPVLIIPIVDTNNSILPIQDLSVASENMFLQATSLGLGTVWKNLEHDWQDGVRKLLNIPTTYVLINIIPVGYPQKQPEPHLDAEFSIKKIHQEDFNN